MKCELIIPTEVDTAAIKSGDVLHIVVLENRGIMKAVVLGKPSCEALGFEEPQRGRPPVFRSDATIKVVNSAYPFRKGSNHEKVLALYKKGMTVAEFERACEGKPWRSTPKMLLASHRRKGVITVS